LMVEAEGDEKKILYEAIRSLPAKTDEEIGRKKILDFIQQGIARNILRENLPAIEGEGRVNLISLKESVEEISTISPIEDTTYDYGENIESFRQVFTGQGRPFYTGIKALDEALRLPPMTGEQWIILAPPGRGKTQTLLNLTFRAAELGGNCLYVTAGDQGLSRIVHRLNPIITGIPWQRLEDPSARVAGLLRRKVRENIISKGGRIRIQDWSDSSCCPADIEALIIQGGYDFAAIDYPDIMVADRDSRYKERRHEIASIFSAIRRIGRKHDVLMWNGSQANRPSLDKARVTMKDTAEDIQKCWVADGIVTYCQTDEEKEESVGRFFIPKVRRPPLKSYEIDIEIEEDTGRII